jgi:dihydrofolate synthase / folylpolyglutamate synthase
MNAPRPDALDWLFGLEKLGIKFGLENIRALCAALRHPEAAWPSVIIAGTNGKGSVAAMVEAGLRAAGVRTGLYTSPHLVRLEERFAIGGRPVATPDLLAAAGTVRETVSALHAARRIATAPTFFEVTTAIAFELFRREAVEFAVLEVGLGGRFDATNAASPLAGAITTIDFDHERFLGNTLPAIAGEKAGIVKAGMRLVVGETKQEAVDVIAAACRERGAEMVPARAGVTAAVRPEGDRLVLELATPRRSYRPVPLALRGRHQVENAIVAVRLLEELAHAGHDIGADAIATGLAGARWPGRLDLRIVAPGRRVLLDAAHNPAGARVLADYLREFHPGPLPIVFGIMRDKDVSGTLAALLPLAAPLILTRPNTDRALPLDALERAAHHLGRASVLVEREPSAALERAWSSGPLACVAGSIFLVGDVLADLETAGGGESPSKE